ncbi:sulfotransferase family protein, partial [Vibrio splendidus]|uniref:sulfotransferase family 2 domain-containing protein n=1 Tax=Vibrio splendidus TaxID=29497 RepID=UPI0024698C55
MLRWKIKRALNLFYFSFIKKKIPKHVKDTNVLFVHIPKAAGISITKSLYGQEIGHKRSVDFMRADENWFNNANKFSIVRNPYTRLISAYNFLKDGGIEKYKFDKEFSVFI